MIQVAIIGVGLIGGSLGMALRSVRRGGKRCYRVTGIGRDRARLSQALRRKAADAVTTDIEAGVGGADIVVIGTPVNAVAGAVARIAPYLKKGAAVTDVGSIKAGIVAAVAAQAPRVRFVGSHPMAGSEKTGVAHASKDLFLQAIVAVVPGEHAGSAASAIKAMWRDAGARVIHTTGREHDRLVAVTSHLPHVMAFALCRQAGCADRKNKKTERLIAGSFRDMTRVADSDVRQWTAIASGNREELDAAIGRLIEDLRLARKKLSNPRELEKYFAQGRAARARLVK